MVDEEEKVEKEEKGIKIGEEIKKQLAETKL